MNLGTHMPDGERRKPINIEVCRSKVKVTTSKNRKKIDTFFVSAQYLKYKKLSTHMPHAERNKSHEQLGFRTFGALLIFIKSYVLKGSILIYKLHCRWCIIHICSVQFLTKISRFF